MKRYVYQEPKGFFARFIELILLCVFSIAMLRAFLCYLRRNLWVILIAIIVAGTIIAFRIIKRRRDRLW